MQNTEPVFKSVGQALFLAFVMEITPPTTKGATQIMIEDLLEQRYGEAPVLKSERTINMGGLTPLEMRAQCALIRETVERLADIERDAIHARFGHQLTRANGVRGLRDYYASLCNTQNREAVLAMLWAIYVPGLRRRSEPDEGGTNTAERKWRSKRATQWSVRAIEKEYGVSKSVVQRDQTTLRSLTSKLEMLAQSKLEERFKQSGLIGEPIDA